MWPQTIEEMVKPQDENGIILAGGLDKVPVDPWGRPYLYLQPGEHGEFDLFSHGKDGQPGGTGEGADVTNWQQ